MANIITWFEIPARDFDRATVFYYKTLGLEVEVTDFNGVSHGIISAAYEPDNKVTGAIVEYPELPDPPAGPILFFDVNGRMELVLDKIERYGGQILKKKTLIKNRRADGSAIVPANQIDGRQGYFAYFQDSEGNKMGLYSNS